MFLWRWSFLDVDGRAWAVMVIFGGDGCVFVEVVLLGCRWLCLGRDGYIWW